MNPIQSIRGMKKEYKIEILFLLAIAVYYTMWARVQPLGVSPDETMRYQVAQYIYEYGTLPRGDAPEILNKTWGISYAFNPILAYMLCAVSMKLMSFFNDHAYALLMAARMVSVFFGVGTVFFAIRIAKQLFSRRETWMFVLVAAFFPNMAFLSSYVNNDSLALFSGAMILYAWIRAVKGGWTWGNCTLLAVGIAICTLSYYNAYGFILCSILLFVLTILFGEKKTWDVKELLQKGIFISAIVLVLAGWWFIRNYMIYDGDFLGREAMHQCAELYAKDGYKPSQASVPKDWGLTPFTMLFNKAPLGYMWIDLVLRSFIGTFGAMSIMQPWGIYAMWWAFLITGLLGTLLRLKELYGVREKGHWRAQGWLNWCMLLALIIPNILNVYYSYASDYQPQGRYSIPMLLPLLYFVTLGYRNIIKKWVKSDHWSRIFYQHMGIFAVILGLYAHFAVFLPNYY